MEWLQQVLGARPSDVRSRVAQALASPPPSPPKQQDFTQSIGTGPQPMDPELAKLMRGYNYYVNPNQYISPYGIVDVKE